MEIHQRNIGHRVKFQDSSVSGLLTKKNDIKKLLEKHGCICLENINFQPKELLQFTQGMFDNIVTLPKQLAFNNQDQIYKSVTRVGNVLVDGTLKDSAKQAIYWHQDGDFWGEGSKNLFNFLHSRQIPSKGGDTWVMDLVEAAKFLKEKKPQVYKKVKQLIGELDFDHIGDFNMFGKVEMNIQTLTHHNVIKPFNRHGYEEVMFLSFQNLLEKGSLKRFQQFNVSYLNELLMNQMGFYQHKWQEGDLLIWDNWQVMHRSAGGFEGRRLLLRTQGYPNAI